MKFINSTFLLWISQSGTVVQSEVLLWFCLFSALKKESLSQGQGCLSRVDCVLVCHMMIKCHVSTLITNKFYLNLIPVKLD